MRQAMKARRAASFKASTEHQSVDFQEVAKAVARHVVCTNGCGSLCLVQMDWTKSVPSSELHWESAASIRGPRERAASMGPQEHGLILPTSAFAGIDCFFSCSFPVNCDLATGRGSEAEGSRPWQTGFSPWRTTAEEWSADSTDPERIRDIDPIRTTLPWAHQRRPHRPAIQTRRAGTPRFSVWFCWIGLELSGCVEALLPSLDNY